MTKNYHNYFVYFRLSLPFAAVILFTTKAYKLHLFKEGHLIAVYLGHPWLRLRWDRCKMPRRLRELQWRQPHMPRPRMSRLHHKWVHLLVCPLPGDLKHDTTGNVLKSI